jgi:hypothetical protein
VDVQTAAVEKSFMDRAEGSTLAGLSESLSRSLAGKIQAAYATGTATLQVMFRETRTDPFGADLKDVGETLQSYLFLKKELEAQLAPRLGSGLVKAKVTLHRHLDRAVFAKDKHWTVADVVLEDGSTRALRGHVTIQSDVVEGSRDMLQSGDVLARIRDSMTRKIRQGLTI